MKSTYEKSFAYFVTSVLCFLCSQSVAAQEKLTYTQIVEIAVKNNILLRQARLQEQYSFQSLRQIQWDLLPKLNASTNVNLNFGRSVDPFSYQFVNQQITTGGGGIFADITIFQGAQRLFQISQNKHLLEADRSNVQKVTNDLVLNIATSYLLILNNIDILSAAEEQMRVVQLQLDREEDQYSLGSKTLADLAQARSQVAAAELNVTSAQNNLDFSYLNLSRLMNRPPSKKFLVQKIEPNKLELRQRQVSPDELAKTALKINPDIARAKNIRLAAFQGKEAAAASSFPRLSLQYNLGTGFSTALKHKVNYWGAQASKTEVVRFFKQFDQNFNQNVGFHLSIPIFNGNISRFSVRKAKIDYQIALASEELAETTLTQIINEAVLDLKSAEKKYYSSIRAYESSKEAFTVVEERYNVGLVNSLDYTQAQINSNKAQYEMIRAKYDLIFRDKIIDFYLGNSLDF